MVEAASQPFHHQEKNGRTTEGDLADFSKRTNTVIETTPDSLEVVDKSRSINVDNSSTVNVANNSNNFDEKLNRNKIPTDNGESYHVLPDLFPSCKVKCPGCS